MKKIGLIILAVIMAVCLTACGGDKAPEATEAPAPAENTAPVISGVQDQTVEAGSEIDLLAGVTATDAEDGDLTEMIAVTEQLLADGVENIAEASFSYDGMFCSVDILRNLPDKKVFDERICLHN